MIRFIFCAAILSSIGTALADVDGKQLYRATVRHIESGGIGYEEGYTTLETFLTSDPGFWAVSPFLDARGHVFNNGKCAANVGLGLRKLWNKRVYGVSAYYDYRSTGRLHSDQLGVGLETLGEWFDFYLNGYLPMGATTCVPYDTTFGTFSGHRLLLSQKHQTAMKGADAGMGFHFGKSELFDFYVAGGPYYFTGTRETATWGGKVKIAGSYKDFITLELSNSYDRTFHNKFQGQISLTIPFGPGSYSNCNNRLLQPVNRQEIIVIDKKRKNSVAVNPATGRPYYFVFVDNTSRSDGTYENPYHSLIQAQNNSSPNDIIYVFPGDGTTKGMDSGISLKDSQKLWGSGIKHAIQTTEGIISIPAQSSSLPTITNTNINTDGNIVDLATNNAISGFILTSANNDAIFGADPQSLDVSFCTFTNTTTYTIEAYFSGDASISIANNQFLNNVNGVFLSLDGTSSVSCLENTFTGQTSISSIPIEILSSSNTLVAEIRNNLFENNTTGSVRFDLNGVASADLIVSNNTMTNNGSGALANVGSNVTILSNGTNDFCSITLQGNTFSENASNALYLDSSGAFTMLLANVSQNTMFNNGGSGIKFATPTDNLTLLAEGNTIIDGGDNGIAFISSGATSIGNITINNNTITNIGNASDGIAVYQDFLALSLTIQNNEINNCEGTGIISYAPTGIESLALNISDNTINNCLNMSYFNAASGLDIEQYVDLVGSVTNNTLLNNAGVAVYMGSLEFNPTACLTLTGNNSTDYLLSNPVGGVFNLSPCTVNADNVGVINTSGVITIVQSCSNPTPCPP